MNVGLSPTLAVSDLARKLKAEGKDVLDFSAGQPDFPTPEPVKLAGIRAVEENRTGYTATPGIVELREAIAERLCRRRGLHYGVDQIIVSPGAKASLYFAFQALLDPGDRVLLPTPYWTSYPEQLRLAGAEPLLVRSGDAQGFKLTAAQIAEHAGDRTKGIVLNYPSNPTGVSYSAEELSEIGRACADRGLWVIADEIYSDLIYDGRSFVSIARACPEIADRTVVIDGMSKSYSMTGWRIGYAAGPREVIAAMTKLQSHSTSNATSIAQWASVAALQMSADALDARLIEFADRRRAMLAGLRAIPGVECVEPHGAFYLFPNVNGCFRGSIDSGQALSRFLLEEAGVAVVPGEAFGSDRHVRLSYATSRKVIDEGLERIARVLRRLTVG